MIGDFNGDGILDIAAAGPMGVWLLTGKGGGTFNAAVLSVSLEGCFTIASADFNRDGNLDIVVTRTINDKGAGFAVMLGKGNGMFQTPQTFTTPKRPDAIAVGSLTKSGSPGIVAGESFSSDVYLYFGNGAGGFSAPKHINLPGGFSDGLAIGDLNGDGYPDVVSDTGYVAYGEGGGNFSAAVSYPVDSGGEPSNAVLADLRNNGLIDIITGSYAAISVLLNQEHGAFKEGIWTSVTGGAGCGVKADFNGDARPDLAVNTPSGISILLGTGKAATPFAAGTNITLAGAACLVTGDLNGDGIADLLVPVNNGTVVAYLGDGHGGFTLQSTTPTPSGGYLALGDFNHDGKLDFATSGNLIALGNGDGTFQNPTDIVANPPSEGFSGIAAGDINNDGWKDLVLTSNVFPVDANITLLLNNKQGGFTQMPTSFGALTVQPVLADLDGDGNLDLILSYTGGLANNPPLGASIYLGNGAGKFTLSETLGTAVSNPSFNLVADVNGDGIPDILVLENNTIEIYLGEGNATYAAPFAIGTGPSPAASWWNIFTANRQRRACRTSSSRTLRAESWSCPTSRPNKAMPSDKWPTRCRGVGPHMPWAIYEPGVGAMIPRSAENAARSGIGPVKFWSAL